MDDIEECLNVSNRNPLNNTSLAASLSGVIKLKIMPAVCVFGIVGNILNLTILTRRKLQKSFRTLERAANLCLIALALSDLLICFFAFLTILLPLDGLYKSESGLLITFAIYQSAIINVFILESTLLTVVMSLERYLAICFPLRQDLYMTPRRTKIIIVITFVFSVVFNLPVLWRFKAEPLCVSNTTTIPSAVNPTLSVTQAITHTGGATLGPSVPGYNISNENGLNGGAFPSECASRMSCARSGAVAIANYTYNGKLFNISTHPSPSGKPSGLGIDSNSTLPPSPSSPSPLSPNYTLTEVSLADNKHVDAAYRFTWLVAGNILPLLLLIYFNVNLWWKIYLSYKMRREFYHRSGTQQQASTPRSSHIITVTLVAIVVMFLIFVAPSETVLYVKRHHFKNLDVDIAVALEDFFNLMQSINFSSNFILYCIISPYFRKALKAFVCCGFYNNYQVSKDFKKEYQTSLM